MDPESKANAQFGSTAQITTVESQTQLYNKPFQIESGKLKAVVDSEAKQDFIKEETDEQQNEVSVSQMEKQFEEFQKELRGEITHVLPKYAHPRSHVTSVQLSETPTLSRLQAQFGGTGSKFQDTQSPGLGLKLDPKSRASLMSGEVSKGRGDLSSRAANALIEEELRQEVSGFREENDYLFE